MAESEKPTEDGGWNRRRLLILLVLPLLLVIGAGVGTFVLPDGPDQPPVTTATPGPTETPTQTPDGPAVEPTDTPTSVPTATATPDPTATPDATDTPTATPGDTPAPTPEPTSTPTPTATPPPPTSTPTGEIVMQGDGQVLSTDGVAPGQQGTGTLTVENAGDADGEFYVTDVVVTDLENGLTDPEADVDSTPNDGELAETLEVRVLMRDGDGNEQYILGTDAGYVPLADLPANAPSSSIGMDAGETVTVETQWRVPGSAGNEIQSDGVDFDVEFELRSPNP